jgi:hypothetical protein
VPKYTALTAWKDRHPHNAQDSGGVLPNAGITHNTQENYMNPFELRFSVFNTAKDFLEQQYKANLVAFEAMDKATKQAVELAPKFPTMEEVIEKAVEINKFVSDANERELTKIVKRASGIGIVF